MNQKLDQLLRHLEKIEERLGQIEHRLLPDEGIVEGPSPPEKTTAQRRMMPVFRGLPSKLLWIITNAATVVGIVAAWVGLRYEVSAMPYQSLNPSDPSATRFLITNEGPFTIYDVGYACKFVPPHQPTNKAFFAFATLTAAVDSLRSHGAFSAYCKLPDSLPRPLVEGTLLDVEVIYTPKYLFWRHNIGGELMMLRFDQNHNSVWLPVKDMTLQLDDLRKMSCATCSQ